MPNPLASQVNSTQNKQKVVALKVRPRVTSSESLRDIFIDPLPSIPRDASGHSIVIEFPASGFIDSAGLGRLISFILLAQKASAKVGLVCLSDHTRSIFTQIRMKDIAPIFDTQEEAIASFDA